MTTSTSDLHGGTTGRSAGALAALPEVLTVREAAAILRVGRNQLYQAIARGELAAVRIGRSIRIPNASPHQCLGGQEPLVLVRVAS
jgi:excisionase family DNA binding protein